ncbi:MAG: signal peptidase I [Gemmatimonadetes bacterium]|nr:signal peptidase I [Gemmatimonadota bacterium]
MKAPPPPPEKKKPTLKEEAKSWGKAGLVAFVIWLFLRSYLIEAFRIPSPSMENTLLVGDFLFVNKVAFGGEFELPFVGLRFLRLPGYSTAHHDQVVIFRSVEDSTPNLNIVKRIIGEPGDTLQMIRDTVYRDGRPLPEPYALHLAGAPVSDDPFRLHQFRAWQLPHYVGADPAGYHPTSHDWGPIVVPRGHYFMMGDNRDESYDSRYWGFLPQAHVVGRPLVIYMSVAARPFRIRWNRLLRHPA